MHMNPNVPFLLNADNVRPLHDRAVRILDQVGLRISDPRLIRRLREKRGVRISGNRVTFAPTVIEELVNLKERQKEPLPAQPKIPEKISIITSYHARHIVDLDSGNTHPLTETDAIQITKLSDALRDRGVLGGAPGAPQDVPARLRSVAQYKISLEWSRAGHYAPVSSVAEYRYIREMARVMGNEFGMECYLISPLRLEGDEVTAVIDYLETCSPADKPVPICATSMPTMGLSGPVDPLALFVLGIAEAMGGFIALTLAYGDEVRVGMSRPNAYPCDFRTGGFIVGSPEAVLIEIIRRDFDRFYRCGSWARALRTMSSVPGIQTAAEKAAGAVACALAGYDTWFGGGLIGLDEVFSPLQLLIDCEIRDYALQVVQGFQADETFDDVAVLKDILESEADSLPFMTHPTTLDTFRKVFREPNFFRREPYKGQSQPKEEMFDQIRNEAKSLIRSHDYRLEAAKLSEIERIYTRAGKELA
jgi:trimethylamine---corrinoid protein Co-methyltransferase